MLQIKVNVNHFEKIESYLPLDLANLAAWPIATGTVAFFVIFRYFLFAGSAWWVFYSLRPNWSKKRQIYAELPKKDVQFFEIRWSVLTSAIFAFFGVALGWIWQMGWTRIYLPFQEWPLWYMPISLLLFAVLHDIYFYITHRMLHWPPLYREAHYVHHHSLHPSPWASFSFHPIEAVIQALPLLILPMIIPIHPVVLLFYLTLMTLSAINNHSGFELLPRGSARHWAGQWIISGVHHASHHRWYRTNYGLFFTWCDRLLKTEREGYPEEFDRATGVNT
jgi:Delta7-sterol 5-desaturase